MTKQIMGYENYTIDENGQIFNTVTKKYLKGTIGENGYRYYRLSKNNTKKMFYAHRLIAEAFIPNPLNLPVVNHKDGNKLNNAISNLEWISYSENVQHAHDNNLISGCRLREYYKEDLENEEWKTIPNIPYSVSSYGRVRNDRTNLLLKPSLACGYYKVRPSINGKAKDVVLHNLVYCVFHNIQEIPQGYVVDHINGDKLNNNLDNLRLITLSENVKSAFYKTKTNKSCKRVGLYTKEGKFIREFPSTAEAARALDLDSSSISKVCRGVNKSRGGFVFKYLDD